ncbi:DUF6174 domain-containing protein [Nocardioides sp. T2.26MG-1]|uniref:DUF6174 domain-containing protein n=1 Tax=Nocardioides sp. T2.26MG-1 TaxID=3041166 RepID=UPI00247777D3|nr:DUF6174 domain-containing protein [Nocardioides sp. T2.26MG-1]CAI9402261.1 hypothetical protein HIDPHFAB_00779 [Nocardioides sp. T2.26MG-1]
MRRLLCLLAVVPVLAAGCGDGSEPAARAGGTQRAELPAAYSFDLTSSCGERSLIGSFRVWVEDGEVAKVEPVGRTPRPRLQDVPTIADLEQLIERAGPDAVVEVERDDDGALRSVSIDPRQDTIDDEQCYEVSGLRDRTGSAD